MRTFLRTVHLLPRVLAIVTFSCLSSFTEGAADTLRIGGQVLDSEGRTIPGVVVYVTYQGGGPWLEMVVETDEDGRWECDLETDTLERATILANHPDWAPEVDKYEADAVAELIDQSATLTMVRGFTVRGSVTTRDRVPVAGAEIRTTQAPGLWVYTMATISNAVGEFTFQARLEYGCIFQVSAPAHEPTEERFAIYDGMGPVELFLEPHTILRGRVTDTGGDDLAGVTVTLLSKASQWQPEILPPVDGVQVTQKNPWIVHTGSDGAFQWDGLIQGEYRVTFEAEGFRSSSRTLAAGPDTHNVVLSRVLCVTGAVTDAVTGAPVDEINLVVSHVPGPLAKTDSTLMHNTLTRYEGGRYEKAFESEEQPFHLLVRGPNYLAAVSEPVYETEGTVLRDFVLTPGNRIVGMVESPDGDPLGGVQVGLSNGIAYPVVSDGSMDKPDVVTGGDGRFELWPSEQPFTVVLTHASGFAVVSDDVLAPERPILLEPWQRMEGEAYRGAVPAPAVQVAVYNRSLRGSDRPMIRLWSSTETDGSGRFQFAHMMPGEYGVARWVRAGTMMSVIGYATTFTWTRGDDVTYRLGRDGRAVEGTIELPDDVKEIVSGDLSYCTAESTDINIPYPPSLPENDAYRRHAWLRAWRDTPEGQLHAQLEPLHRFAAPVGADGRFRLDDVRSGRYVLKAVLYHRDSDLRHTAEVIVGGASAAFEVADFEPGADLPALDLGRLEFTPAKWSR